MTTEKHASPAEHWLPATALITVITGIGFALRTWNLAERSIWFDEAFSWTLSSQFSPLEIIQRTAKDTHPPLYGLLLWAWMKGFGDSLMAIRMLSAVSGTLAIIVAYFSGVEAIRATQKCGSIAQTHVDNSGRLLGILFAMLLACSPFQVHWSREVRMYAVLTLLFLVSVLMGLRALNKSSKSPWNWIAFCLASSLMLYTHNYAIFSYAAINCGLTAR